MKNLLRGVVVACVLAGVMGVSVEAHPHWIKKTKPIKVATVCYDSVCTWSPCGSFCTIFVVPCGGGEPGVEPGNPGDEFTNGPTPARR